jgi:hypothetical protein
MPNASGKLVITKLCVISAAILIAFLYFFGYTEKYNKIRASASGPSPSHTNAPDEANCASCHSDFPVNSGSGSVTIGAIPKNYLPNQQIPITVTTAQSDAVIYGFQLTAIDSTGATVGTFSLPTQNPAQMQISDNFVNGKLRYYVAHTVDGVIPTQFGSKTWTFNWTAPAQRAGKVSFYVAGNAANSDANISGDYIYTATKATLSGSATSNFDSDTASDIAVWRPQGGVWFTLNSSDGNYQVVQFGADGDKIVPGDYDGDGKTDFAVWRPSTGVWYIQKSDGSGFIITQFGTNGDIPASGDYDGDLKSDLAVYRPSTGVWYIFRSSNGSFDIRQFGTNADKIAQGDYDGDGKTDIAVWRPSTGVWYIWKSSDNNFFITGFGLNGDKPVQADYDGDGKHDVAVYRPSTGVWYLLRSSGGFAALQFGISTDKPVPADFDGDGKHDISVFRDGVWYAVRSSDNNVLIVSFGFASDIPVSSGYLTE